MHRIVAAKFGAPASVVMMWSVAPPFAHASPEDPYGNDWVAMAVAPTAPGTPMSYGLAGTQEEAVGIAMDLCTKGSAGHPCYVVSTIEYGCVAAAINERTGAFTGGRGPDETSAIQEAADRRLLDADPEGFNVAGVQCSIPLTPPQ
ncbi:DUF4189 domain-containing protein [Mycobacterium sp. NBC_00419]|uniref:DUF4189 domain-containing protein n=1 Tax=Mycobacterium sp. NBC_00419 TaxID=2975989 RepID=UPI002E22471C